MGTPLLGPLKEIVSITRNMTIELPQPRNWDDLEDLVCDILSDEMSDANLQRFGRAGQGQHGIDILGYLNGHAIGIQCKHYRGGTTLSIKTIKSEFKKTSGLGIPIKRYVFATTAKRDVRLQRQVVALNARRPRRTTFHVLFWEDLQKKLWENKGLLYRHYGTQLPLDRPADETSSFVGKTLRRTASVILHPSKSTFEPIVRERGAFVTFDPTADRTQPASVDDLNRLMVGKLNEATGAAARPNKYNLALGVSDFSGTDFAGIADLSMNFSHLFDPAVGQGARQKKVMESFQHLASVLAGGGYSDTLIVYAKARLATSFMLGWSLKKVGGFHLKMVMGDKLWGGEHLKEVPSLLTHALPILVPHGGRDVAVVLNISREITDQVKVHYATVARHRAQAGMILPITLPNHRIESGAHASAVARDIATQLKALSDSTAVRRIHLFGAMPTALAALIATRLNATRPIEIYFRESDRENFVLGAVLTAAT